MHQVYDSGAPAEYSLNVPVRVVFPLTQQGRHAHLYISELNTEPALSPVNA